MVKREALIPAGLLLSATLPEGREAAGGPTIAPTPELPAIRRSIRANPRFHNRSSKSDDPSSGGAG